LNIVSESVIQSFNLIAQDLMSKLSREGFTTVRKKFSYIIAATEDGIVKVLMKKKKKKNKKKKILQKNKKKII